MQNITPCVRTWWEVRNFAWHRQESAHFEQTGLDPVNGSVQVSRSESRFSNFFFFGIWHQHNHKM